VSGQVRHADFSRPRNRRASPLYQCIRRGLNEAVDGRAEPVLKVWLSHGDRVQSLPEGFHTSGSSRNSPLAAMEDPEGRYYGVQFHSEVTHTLQEQRIIHRFVRDMCGCAGEWTPAHIVSAIEDVRRRVGKGEVLLGLSGGVDSSVVATLLHEAIGDQLTCAFVDHGLHSRLKPLVRIRMMSTNRASGRIS